MLGSTEDAEDVLQEVFVNAYRAMLADEREINLRPWLYRIARNRCLNHLRKPKADAQESMDMVPAVEAASTAEKVHNREEFRQILSDVNKLPETQRAALLLREIDALSYEEIAEAMDTTVPSVKSLLVRARISLAEASQARMLTCGEVRVELAEAAEGLPKASAPVRRHVRDCDECADFRNQLRTNKKTLAALIPVGPLLALKGFIAAKLGLGGAGARRRRRRPGAAGAGAAGAGAVGGVGAALGGSGAAGGIGAIGGAIGAKALAGVVTAAVLTAGAVEVKQQTSGTPVDADDAGRQVRTRPAPIAPRHRRRRSRRRRSSKPTQRSEAARRPHRRSKPTTAARGSRRPRKLRPPPTTGRTTKPSGQSPAAPVGVGNRQRHPDRHHHAGQRRPTGASAGAPTGTGTVVVTVGGRRPPADQPAGRSAPAEPAAAPPPPAEPNRRPPAASSPAPTEARRRRPSSFASARSAPQAAPQPSDGVRLARLQQHDLRRGLRPRRRP